jgi:polyhydroxyalkanoate synthesis regulator protein
LEHKRALKELEELCQSPSTDIIKEEIEARADIQRRILTIKCSLDLTVLGRDYASELLKLHKGPNGNGNESMVENYMEMDLESTVQELEGFNGVLKRAIDKELSLRTKMQILNLKLTKKSSLMRHMMDNNKHPLHLHPSRFILEGG